MTCIAGMIDKQGRAWIAGDRRATTTNEVIVQRATPKVFRRGDVLMGTCGLASVARSLEELDLPVWPSGMRLDEWAWHRLLPPLREAVREYGEMSTHDGMQVVQASGLLLGRGQVVYLGAMSSAVQHALPYFAVGSGCDYALGSIHATKGMEISVFARLHKALAAAAVFDPAVAPPFDILNDFEGA